MTCIGPFLAFAAYPEVIYLVGDILDDAPAAFLRALRKQPQAKVLILASDGGYIDPALLVAKEVRARGLSTYVPFRQVCASACSYVFFAGVARKTDGRLGVHQLANGNNDLEEGQAALADVFSTLKGFGVADGVVAQMLATRPDDMYFFDRNEIASLGIENGDPFGAPALKSDDRLPAEGNETAALTARDAVATNPEGTQSLLLEASDDGKTGAVPFSGTVEWSKGQDETGLPTLVGKASIPARNLGVDVLIRKNVDPSLPASHLMEINFRVSDSFIGGSVAGLPGVLLKNEELVQGAPLVGASSRVVGNSFLFALSAAPEDNAANNQLLTSRKWIDLAIIYATGKRAIITLEKDTAAEAMFNDVFTAWGGMPALRAYVQLSSQLSEAEAQMSLRNAQSKWGGLFRGQTLEIERADLGGEGTYYRVRLVVPTAAEANSICTGIKDLGGDCFVTSY